MFSVNLQKLYEISYGYPNAMKSVWRIRPVFNILCTKQKKTLFACGLIFFQEINKPILLSSDHILKECCVQMNLFYIACILVDIVI